MSNRDISYPKILTEDASFQLVRTNPKLTGNIKIAINESGNMWLESIKANPELSKDLYSKVSIDVAQSHPANIFRFLNNGTTPNEIIFDLSERVDSTKTSKDFKDQYDFSNYFSGAKYLASNKYTERMSYFAPLYLKKDIPSYFVILKLDDPSNFPLDQMKALYEANESKTDYLIDLFSKASIIKTFDLSPQSIPGKYIRDYIASPNFPTSSLTVGFAENDFTTWNGILANEGTFGSRGELLDTLYQSSQPLKFFEENITNGFSRNGIIFPNILNLEFIFNDDSSAKYDFNRYLGIYVNAIELSKLDIDLDRAYLNRGTWENIPHFRKKFLENEDVRLIQSNKDGVIIPYKNSDINISEFNNTFTDSSSLFLNYIRDKNNNLYIPKVTSPYVIDYTAEVSITLASAGTIISASSLTPHGYINNDLIVITTLDPEYSGEFLVTVTGPSSFDYTVDIIPTLPTSIGTAKKELTTGQIRFANNKIDLGLFFGQSQNLFLQDTGNVSKTPGHSHSVITINNNLNNYDEIKIYHPHGTRVDSIGKYELITSTQLYPLIPGAGEYYVYNDYDNILGYDEFYLNGGGYLHQVADALAGCINGIRNRTFTAYAYNEKVFIKLNPAGDFDTNYKVSFTSPSLNYSVITIHDTTGSSLIGNPLDFKGGSKEIGNRLIIDASHLTKINQNFKAILIKSTDGWSTIRKVSQYIDDITESNSITPALRSKSIESFTTKLSIILDDIKAPTISHNDFLMRLKYRPSFGLLSFFSIKDLDFDFYSSTYTNFPEIDLYQHYFIPPNTLLLTPGIDYIVYGGKINVDNGTLTGIDYPDGSQFTVSSQTNYSIIDGSPIVSYDPLSNNGFIPVNDKNTELLDFAGFSIIKDPSKVVPQNSSNEYILKTKYLNGLTDTEYDYYKENESLDFALRSKLIPYITKWGIKSGKDSRDNPYRLNTEIVFGRNNFSPDHEDRTQNPLNFTHEWFYINSKFNYIDSDLTVSKNTNYFEEYFDEVALVTDPNYFINYFTYTPTNTAGKEIADTQYRYSSLYKNSAGKYEAFFRGFKLTFKDVTDPLIKGADGKPIAKDTSTRFEGYKFSCILKPVKESINDQKQAPIKYKVIEHTANKFIVVVIELAIGYNGKAINGLINAYTLTNIGTGYSNTLNVSTTSITGVGTGLTLNIIDDGSGGILTATINTYGIGYEIGDTVTINSGNGDAVLTITNISDMVDPYWGNLSTISNYVNNTNFTDPTFDAPNSFPTVPQLPFDTINGDYRIEFDSTGVSNLTNTYLYSLKNKKYNNEKDSFANTKMTSKLSLQAGVSIVNSTVKRLQNSDISNYPSILTDDIIKPTESTLILIRDTNLGIDLVIDSTVVFVPQAKNIIDKVSEQFIRYDSSQGILGIVDTSLPIPAVYGNLPAGSTTVIEASYSFKVLTGGEKYFEKIFEKISFARFKKYINDLAPIIEYESYSDNTGIPSTSPNFYLEVLDHAYVEKSTQLITNYTTSIPIQFSGQENIGVDYESPALTVPYELNRYRGEYEPVTQNYSIYQSNFKFKNNNINDLLLSNVKINSDVSDLFTIKNFNHIKVADSQILILESDDSYLPIYPKIGEIAIGQSDYFLLAGNWDWGFHHKYSNKTSYLPVSGALRVEEDDSFISKLITLPEVIEIMNLTITTLDDPTQDINSADISNIELLIKETPSAVEGIINLNNVISRFLINDGISTKFNEYLINSNEFIGNFNSIDEYVKQYIKLNILKLYDIDITEFYAKVNNTIVSSNTQSDSNPNAIDFVFLNDTQLFKQGFNLIKSLQINKKDRLILKFSFTKKQGSGLSISPKIKIKFI